MFGVLKANTRRSRVAHESHPGSVDGRERGGGRRPGHVTRRRPDLGGLGRGVAHESPQGGVQVARGPRLQRHAHRREHVGEVGEELAPHRQQLAPAGRHAPRLVQPRQHRPWVFVGKIEIERENMISIPMSPSDTLSPDDCTISFFFHFFF